MDKENAVAAAGAQLLAPLVKRNTVAAAVGARRHVRLDPTATIPAKRLRTHSLTDSYPSFAASHTRRLVLPVLRQMARRPTHCPPSRLAGLAPHGTQTASSITAVRPPSSSSHSCCLGPTYVCLLPPPPVCSYTVALLRPSADSLHRHGATLGNPHSHSCLRTRAAARQTATQRLV